MFHEPKYTKIHNVTVDGHQNGSKDLLQTLAAGVSDLGTYLYSVCQTRDNQNYVQKSVPDESERQIHQAQLD